MNTFDDQEEQTLDHLRGCQIGACFACGLGVGTRLPPENGHKAGHTDEPEWQSSRPNPLPGIYLPLEMFSVFREADDGTPFYSLDDPEFTEQVAAFLSHENVHRRLLVGIVPMVMRLIASRCYALLGWQIKNGFNPYFWDSLLSQSKNIENLFKAIALNCHNIVGVRAATTS